jgi:LAS superfamily LD-carboxypeptidase LdcB
VSGGSGCILGNQNGCDGNVAIGLTNQIAAKLGQMGYSFKSLDSNWIHCDSSNGCVNMLQASAADSLAQAAASAGDYITLNSAWRSSAEQYMLYRWYQNGMCGITLAAQPGSSNHEGGRAVDTSYYNYWAGTLSNYGWAHSYPSSDPVHFDYYGATDIAQQNLMAFQMLWNEHNGDQLTVDGIYGPATENALYNAPCGGW